LRVINPEHYFVLCDGRIIKDLHELIVTLKTIDKKTFEYHVTDQKNDFANWIRHVYRSNNVAEIISDYSHKEIPFIIKTIKKFMDERKILVVNAGSSSLKFQLIEIESRDLLMKGSITGMNTNQCLLSCIIRDETITRNVSIKNHEESIQAVIDILLEKEALGSVDEISAIGHRVVHGGEIYKKPVVITAEVIAKLTDLSALAPLHNPSNVSCIMACQNKIGALQVAVFDTAFHSTIPKEKYLYGLPYEYYEKHSIRKYGFHGTSHEYIASLVQEYYRIEKKKKTKIIICHLGNGSSITAVKDGKSLNTTMGFTPVDGLIMGTRVGHVDPVVSIHLGKHLNLSYDDMSRILNKESGLLGISGFSDMRLLWKNRKHPRCKLAIDMFIDRIVHYIGAYIAEMNGVDGIIFTAGIGENAQYIRKGVLEQFSYVGLKIDDKKNNNNEFIITRKDSKVDVFVIQTNEEIQIASKTQKLLKL
jgi:acetate kinase